MRVAPKLMGATPRRTRAGKSDQIDARAIARAVLQEGMERFPAAFLDERAMEIRLLCDHREELVNERNRLTNRLRWNLVILDPALEAASRLASSTTQASSTARRQAAAGMPQTVRVRIANEQANGSRCSPATQRAQARAARPRRRPST